MERLGRREDGQALVEFALYFSVFIFIFAGIVDISVYIRQEVELTWAASPGASYGTIPGHSTDITGMNIAAAQAAPDVNGLSVSVGNCYSCSPGGGSAGSGSTCSDGFPPMLFVQVTTSATVPAVFRWTGIANNISLQGYAVYEVPWS